MQSIKSLKQLINDNAPAFYITNASLELVKEIQSILGITATGVVDDRTKEVLAKFKSDRNLQHPLGLGISTAQALLDSKPKKQFKAIDANQIIKTMKTLGYKVFEGQELNIVYLEGIDPGGEINSDSPNQWNDLRTVIKVVDGNAQFLGKWRATTEPGNYYTHNPMNPGGAARIAFGQYKAWQVGTHGNSQPHEALVQTGGAVKVHRDLNKDFYRTGDKVTEGLYGINQHWGYDQSEVGRASAGCLVGQSRSGHREFMAIAKNDSRYQENSKYVFWSTILDGSKLS